MADVAIREYLSSTFYRLLLNNLPDSAVFVFDQDLRYIAAEGPFLATSGIAPEHILGKTISEVLGADANTFMEPFVRAGFDGKETEFNRQIGAIYYHSKQVPIRSDEGHIIAVMMISRDITKQRQTEQALKQAESHYRLLAENNSDLILEMNLQRQYVYVSPASLSVLGYTPEEMLDKTIADFAHPNDVEKAANEAVLALENKTTAAHLEMRLRHKDGHYVWIERSAKPILCNETGTITGLIVTLRDVTARKQIEAALIEREEQFRLLMENNYDAILLGDEHFNIVMANAAAARMFGYRADEFSQMNSLRIVDPNDVRLADFFQQPKHLAPVQAEVTGIKHDGTQFPLQITGFTYATSDGTQFGWIVARDLSEQKRYQQSLMDQEKLEIALEKEIELSVLKSRIMERIAHEFRTPLTVIQMTTETLTMYLDRFTPEQREARILNIRKQNLRLTEMLDEIGLAMHGDLIPTTLMKTRINLSVLCYETAKQLEKHFDVPGKFVLDTPPDVNIIGDATTITNAVYHVLRNAYRFSAREDQVSVKIVNHADTVELIVVDKGIGVPSGEEDQIFEPFIRGSNIGEITGLGLGLTIARASVEANHGEITLERTPDNLTVVKIQLPHRAA